MKTGDKPDRGIKTQFTYGNGDRRMVAGAVNHSAPEWFQIDGITVSTKLIMEKEELKEEAEEKVEEDKVDNKVEEKVRPGPVRAKGLIPNPSLCRPQILFRIMIPYHTIPNNPQANLSENSVSSSQRPREMKQRKRRRS